MNQNRWEQAQKYEKNWWNSRKEIIPMNFYQSFANELNNDLKGILDIAPQTQILEIGSGASGILTYLNSDNKFAIDPLEYYYSTVESFIIHRDSKVQYFTGMGEDLPFEDIKFDFIILDNVLDHCSNPVKVFSEMERVLKVGGIIYWRQNTYHFWGIFVRLIMEKIVIDKGHPFSFSKSYLKTLFTEFNFEILKTSSNGYFKTWKKELFAFKPMELAKALLFATRDKTLFILKK